MKYRGKVACKPSTLLVILNLQSKACYHLIENNFTTRSPACIIGLVQLKHRRERERVGFQRSRMRRMTDHDQKDPRDLSFGCSPDCGRIFGGSYESMTQLRSAKQTTHVSSGGRRRHGVSLVSKSHRRVQDYNILYSDTALLFISLSRVIGSTTSHERPCGRGQAQLPRKFRGMRFVFTSWQEHMIQDRIICRWSLQDLPTPNSRPLREVTNCSELLCRTALCTGCGTGPNPQLSKQQRCCYTITVTRRTQSIVK